MADGTAIEWTDATWNPITGCAVVSPGCTNCYAMKLAGTRLRHHPSRAGLTRDTKAGPVWTGEARFNEQWLLEPLRWTKPRRIFVCAHADLFGEAVPDEWIDRIFAVMALAPQHQFQVLTKRAERMRAWFDRYDAAHDHNCADFVADQMAVLLGVPGAKGAARTGDHDWDWPLRNVWLGVSVEDQTRADERIPHLLATPGAVRWLSCEPLLGPVDLEPWLAWPDNAPEVNDRYWGCVGCDSSCDACPNDRAVVETREGPADAHGVPEWMTHRRVTLDWIVAGGESGPGARPMHPDWARSLRDQCAAASVPFLFKQWGEWLPLRDYAGSGYWPTNSVGCARLTNSGEKADVGYPLQRVGKKRAGRLLDGQLHDGFPS
jgi:protein gp37